MDDEYARAAAHAVGDAEPAPMSPLGYSREVELLSGVYEAIQSLQSTLIAVNSKLGKGPKVERLPRPKTAFERARREVERQQMREIAVTWFEGGVR